MTTNRCNCGKKKLIKSKRCRRCFLKNWVKGKRNPHYIDGRALKIYYCKDCNKRLCNNWRALRCRKCEMIRRRKEGCLVNHHKYLKKYSNKVIKMIDNKHSLLHNKVYEYLFIKYGKSAIDKYLIWFRRKYGNFTSK